ncbi:shikimate dehydrogenase family protein [Sediminibacterium sp. TEGAF015]|uniref:shikimate dehydrogenase family protein n=1 Tax=Sediminibacterium sp. TEGAF015 TaxID=575378 RepID=UPI0021FA3C4D|nr:shikimate dehydrogenase [Sediminibacterium sp. TEGAF015]BDQ10852.1 shikimate 5-dehydrogenase [Sediminibacterium sp. TEGAF015]
MQLYGLLGYPLTHSFSQRYFTEKFSQLGLTAFYYQNFAIPSIEQFPQLLVDNPFLNGFNVTIPYKKQIIPFLHEMNEAVREMGACNCVHIKNGKLNGFNTDIIGFEQSLLPFLKPSHTNALILGTGGAAAAVAYVLRKLQISYLFVSRNTDNQTIQYNQVDAELLKKYTLIINTSPVGQFPDIAAAPAIPYKALGLHHHLFDLIYNPETTRFMELGMQQGATVQNGYEMLVLQAEESWRIWNS